MGSLPGPWGIAAGWPGAGQEGRAYPAWAPPGGPQDPGGWQGGGGSPLPWTGQDPGNGAEGGPGLSASPAFRQAVHLPPRRFTGGADARHRANVGVLLREMGVQVLVTGVDPGDLLASWPGTGKGDQTLAMFHVEQGRVQDTGSINQE